MTHTINAPVDAPLLYAHNPSGIKRNSPRHIPSNPVSDTADQPQPALGENCAIFVIDGAGLDPDTIAI